jgi:hypothetical protein
MHSDGDLFVPRRFLKSLERLRVFSVPLGRLIWLKAGFNELKGAWNDHLVDDWT